MRRRQWRKWQAQNREYNISRRADWGQRNRERLRNSMRTWRLKNRDREYAYWIKKQYGMGISEYAALLAFQRYRCALCGVHVDSLPKRPCLDHCHRSGDVRGILCFGCNMALGQAEKHETGAFSYYTQFPPMREMREREENPSGPHPY